MSIALFLLGIHAFAMQGARSENHVYLVDVPCNRVQQTLQSLKQWTESTGQAARCDSRAEPYQKNSKMCAVNITGCVPNHVKKYQNAVPAVDGPNCWNLALVMKGILPALRFSTDIEMEYYMGPPLCHAVGHSNKPRPGDIGAMRVKTNNTKEEFHGFIYISDDLVYTKYGYQRSPYTLGSMKTMKDFYLGLSKKQHGADSELQTEYFRCKSMQQYLAENKDISSSLLSTMNRIVKVERCFESQAMHSPRPDSTAINSLKDVTKILLHVAKDFESQNNAMSEKDSFILGSLYLRIEGLLSQLEKSHDPGPTSMKPLQTMLRKSIKELVDSGKWNRDSQ